LDYRFKSISALIGWLLLCFIVGGMAASVSPGIDTANQIWYANLQKPTWTPPASWFGPVWTVLYALMGVSAWMIWNYFRMVFARNALGHFLIQLGLNGLWSFFFFEWQVLGWATIEITLLLLFIAITVKKFANLRPAAALLLIPYMLWVAFAAALTFRVWTLN